MCPIERNARGLTVQITRLLFYARTASTLSYLASYADFSLSQKCAQSDGKVMEK